MAFVRAIISHFKSHHFSRAWMDQRREKANKRWFVSELPFFSSKATCFHIGGKNSIKTSPPGPELVFISLARFVFGTFKSPSGVRLRWKDNRPEKHRQIEWFIKLFTQRGRSKKTKTRKEIPSSRTVKLLIFIFNLVRNSWPIVACRHIARSPRFNYTIIIFFINSPCPSLLPRTYVLFIFPHSREIFSNFLRIFVVANSRLKLWPPVKSRKDLFVLHIAKAKISDYVKKSSSATRRTLCSVFS